MATDAPAVRYRPHLDGLRAVAVYLVVAFHAGLGSFDGGFVGVDVFFVLSGFLVTKILLVDLVGQGRLDFRRFYARRSRRILPAALFVLLFTAALYRLMAPPVAAVEAMGGFRAASVYVANWFFIGQSTDYFASDLASSPVLHFWSLAVEEQFYLLWPLLLGGLFVAVRRIGSTRWVVLRAIVGALALASAIAAVLIGADDVARAYYGTDTRAYQLLVGALLAITPQLSRLGGRPRRVVAGSAVPAVAAIVILATPLVGVGPITRGLLVTAATALLILALENSRRGPVGTLLASDPMTALGRVSYGTYLWHWPIIVLIALEVDLPPVANFAIAAVGATGLAAISYVLMERPIRSAPRLEGRAVAVVAAGLAASLVAGLVVMPRVLDGGSAEIGGIASGAGAGPTLTNWRIARDDVPGLPDCLDRPASACTMVRGTGKHVLVLGDSIARMWIPALVQLAARDGFTLSAAIYPGCPWLRGVYFRQTRRTWAQCSEHRNDWYSRVVPELAPDVVVLSQIDPQGSVDDDVDKAVVAGDGRVIPPDAADFDTFLRERVGESLDLLAAPGRQVVVVEPVAAATLDGDPLKCLSEGYGPTDCAFTGPSEPTPLEEILRERATSDSAIVTVDLDRTACPAYPRCEAMIDSVIVWRDGSHLTATYARSLAPEVGRVLTAAGVELRQ